MKPYISEILKFNGKTHVLPLPAKYRELLDCVHSLGINVSNDTEMLVGYKAMYVPEPDLLESRYDVERTAERLSELKEEQVKAIGALCSAFALPYGQIAEILTLVTCVNQKEDTDNEDEDQE